MPRRSFSSVVGLPMFLCRRRSSSRPKACRFFREVNSFGLVSQWPDHLALPQGIFFPTSSPSYGLPLRTCGHLSGGCSSIGIGAFLFQGGHCVLHLCAVGKPQREPIDRLIKSLRIDCPVKRTCLHFNVPFF